MSINRWMEKVDVAYVCNGIFFSHGKEGNPVICNNMDGSWGHYAKWNKSDKEKYCMNMWDLKHQIPRNRDEICGYQREGMEGVGETGEGGQKIQIS